MHMAQTFWHHPRMPKSALFVLIMWRAHDESSVSDNLRWEKLSADVSVDWQLIQLRHKWTSLDVTLQWTGSLISLWTYPLVSSLLICFLCISPQLETNEGNVAAIIKFDVPVSHCSVTWQRQVRYLVNCKTFESLSYVTDCFCWLGFCHLNTMICWKRVAEVTWETLMWHDSAAEWMSVTHMNSGGNVCESTWEEVSSHPVISSDRTELGLIWASYFILPFSFIGTSSWWNMLLFCSGTQMMLSSTRQNV